MATTAAQLESARATAPAEWTYLPPWDGEQGTLWQVWGRPKGPAYWLMRYATRASNFLIRLERRLGRDVEEITNPNGLEDFGTVETEERARDLGRIIYAERKGRYSVTYTPVMVGRVYPMEPVLAAGDKRFDPFRVFDFSATDAVREQARHVLVDAREFARLKSMDELVPRLIKRMRDSLEGE